MRTADLVEKLGSLGAGEAVHERRKAERWVLIPLVPLLCQPLVQKAGDQDNECLSPRMTIEDE